MQGLKLCVFSDLTKSTAHFVSEKFSDTKCAVELLTLSSVQLTLLECVDILRYFRPCRLKMNRFAQLNSKFSGAMPSDPHTGEGLRRPFPDPTPSALRRFAPPCLARGLQPLHRPSLCVVDILIYFRPWSYVT